jgi:CDP-glycerol glycerophosphotransferase (TagB/SpsB family)
LAILRSNFLLCTHGSADFFPLGLHGKFNIIMLSHGNSVIKGLHTPKFQELVKTESDRRDLFNKTDDNEYIRYHTVIASSDIDKKNILESRRPKNVKVLGYPRNDIFFIKNIVYENYQTDLNLEKFNKIILYCPTFRDYPSSQNPFSEKFLIKLNEFLKKENSIFLIKGHIDEKSLKNIKNLSNIHDISETVNDIQDLLLHVDLLISDYSSVFFDFVFRNKPMIFYPYDFEEYTENSRNLFCDYFNDLTGPFAKNEDELLKLINSSQNDFSSKEFLEKFETFKKKYNRYIDGKNCERLYNYILKLIT